MTKTVWIINQYGSTPQTGIGGRHHYLARELGRRGYRVCLVVASWHHLLRDGQPDAPEAVEEGDGYTLVRIRVPRYAHAHDKKRMLNWLLFAKRLGQVSALVAERNCAWPHAILYSSPSLIPYLSAARLARRLRARLIFEVRDIWPLTLTELGSFSINHPLIRLMQWIEDRAYQEADHVISNLPRAVDHMVMRGLPAENFTWLPNGISLDEVTNPAPLEPGHAATLSGGGFVLGYAGTMGSANALDVPLEAAVRLLDLPDLRFVLVGKGRDKPRLQARVAELGLKGRVEFLDPIPKAQVQSLLSRFDACLLSQIDTPIYRFGTAPNKLFDYFYAARPVINAYSGAEDFVSAYNAGLQVPAGDPDGIADAVRKLYVMSPDDRARLGANGRNAVLMHFDYARIGSRLEQVLFDTSS